jgi:hypothetical protein
MDANHVSGGVHLSVATPLCNVVVKHAKAHTPPRAQHKHDEVWRQGAYNKFLRGIADRIAHLPSGDGMDATLIEDVACMRVCKSGRISPFQWTCVYGFGSVEKRNLVVRVLRYALGPVMLHGSNVGAGRWEALLLMEKLRADSQEFEQLLDKFHMSIGVVDLETYLGPQMLAAYERIEAGDSTFGTLHLKRNRLHKQNLESFMRRKREVQHTMRVEEEMGRAFTLSSMLDLHREYRVIVVNREAAELELGTVQRGLADALVNLRVVMSMVEHSTLASPAPPAAAAPHTDPSQAAWHQRFPVVTPPPDADFVRAAHADFVRAFSAEEAAEEAAVHAEDTQHYQWYRINNNEVQRIPSHLPLVAAWHGSTFHDAPRTDHPIPWPLESGPRSPPGSPPGPPQRPPTPPTPAQRPPSPPARAQHDPNHFGDNGSALERIMGRLREVSHEVQHARTSVMRASAAAQDGLPGMGAFVF